VNRNVLVKNLNAQYLGGLTATGLAFTGGQGFTPPATDTPISTTAPWSLAPARCPRNLLRVRDRTPERSHQGHLRDLLDRQRLSPLHRDQSGRRGSGGRIHGGGNRRGDSARRGDLARTLRHCRPNGSLANDAGIIAIRVLSSHH